MSRHLGGLLTAFVDGELDHAQREQVLGHLLHCAACRTEADTLRGLKSTLRTEATQAPEHLAARLLAMTAAASQPALVTRLPATRKSSGTGSERFRRTAFGMGVFVLGVGGVLAAAGPAPRSQGAPVDPSSAGLVTEHLSSARAVVGASAAVVPAMQVEAAPSGARLDNVALAALQARGWPVPRVLPGWFELYDARWLRQGVLQLVYCDGVSTLSLFVQHGERVPASSGVVRRVAQGMVWQADGRPERVAWTAAGRTWTVVSDATPQAVDDVVAALPHGPASMSADGLAPRAWRGLSRVGAWLDPFD